MEELAREYERKHAGHVTKITGYSFENLERRQK